jgi:hypothetical protein
VLTHEAGHTLGLWHTHHGVSECPSGDPCVWDCYEHAGSNSDTTGDFASDTPPTPTNNTCNPPGGNDPCPPNLPWGDTQPENYMSYGGPDCWTMFTEQQNGRMHCWINAVLAGWLVTEPVPTLSEGAMITLLILLSIILITKFKLISWSRLFRLQTGI